jgi:deoxyadenosine/deoxycytidine kinase
MTERGQRNYLYVSICGPVASGKTTLAKLLSSHFGWPLLLEDLDANPYLSDYYGDMARWGFRTVIAFLIRALTLQDEIAERLTQEAICQDWNFAEHYATYGVHTFNEGIIDERERQTCEELHRYLMAHQIPPDLVVVMTADPETLLSRIANRQRSGEAAIPPGYVYNLVQLYKTWSATLTVPHLRVDTTADDFAHNAAARERVIARIGEALR